MSNEHAEHDRRTAMLETAGRLFLKNGYEGTSMSQVAAAIGGSKGTLYAYFNNKESLFQAFIQMGVREKAADVFEFPKTPQNVPEVLTRFGFKFLRLITEKDARDLLRLLYREAPHFPQLGKIFYETCLTRNNAHLTAYLTAANDGGVLRVPDPALAAEQFLALCEAKLHMAVMLCVQDDIPTAEAEAVIKGAVALFLAAYGVR